MIRRTLNVAIPDERLMNIPGKNPKRGYVTAAGKPMPAPQPVRFTWPR